MNWFLKKKADIGAEVDLLRCDLHSHVIPGIDDGARTMEDSIELVRKMAEIGYKKMIVTPHVRANSFPNDTDTFDSRLSALKESVESIGIDMEFEIGAEHTIDSDFLDLMKIKKLKTFHDGYLLIEFPFYNLPPHWKEVVFDLQIEGYKLILAHPERYVAYLPFEPKVIEELKNRDILFQMNMTSLAGFYGRGVEKFSKFLIKKNYIDILGTDLHNTRHIENIRASLQNKEVRKLINSGSLLNNKF